jgi:hypothetical protein
MLGEAIGELAIGDISGVSMPAPPPINTQAPSFTFEPSPVIDWPADDYQPPEPPRQIYVYAVAILRPFKFRFEGHAEVRKREASFGFRIKAATIHANAHQKLSPGKLRCRIGIKIAIDAHRKLEAEFCPRIAAVRVSADARQRLGAIIEMRRMIAASVSGEVDLDTYWSKRLMDEEKVLLEMLMSD